MSVKFVTHKSRLEYAMLELAKHLKHIHKDQ